MSLNFEAPSALEHFRCLVREDLDLPLLEAAASLALDAEPALDLQDVLETLRNRPKEVHVCLTGRRCPQEIVDIADTVTEMRPIKHAFDAGIPAQRGIED